MLESSSRASFQRVNDVRVFVTLAHGPSVRVDDPSADASGGEQHDLSEVPDFAPAHAAVGLDGHAELATQLDRQAGLAVRGHDELDVDPPVARARRAQHTRVDGDAQDPRQIAARPVDAVRAQPGGGRMPGDRQRIRGRGRRGLGAGLALRGADGRELRGTRVAGQPGFGRAHRVARIGIVSLVEEHEHEHERKRERQGGERDQDSSGAHRRSFRRDRIVRRAAAGSASAAGHRRKRQEIVRASTSFLRPRGSLNGCGIVSESAPGASHGTVLARRVTANGRAPTVAGSPRCAVCTRGERTPTPRALAAPVGPGTTGSMHAWEVQRTDDGSFTLAHPVHGQACHSSVGAWLESRERYARACRVRERARELVANGQREFHLLDIGTGLGYNLAAALEALDGTRCVLRATSLELERSVIERTLELARDGTLHLGAPAELVRFHAPVVRALEAALATARDETPVTVALADGSLTFVLGDGTRSLPALPLEPRFDAVFLDPFSPRVDPVLWQPAFVAQIARRMSESAVLSTYSASLSVRASLAAAGLHVAPGARLGAKAQGTLASRRPIDARRHDGAAFDARTLRRIARRAGRASEP